MSTTTSTTTGSLSPTSIPTTTTATTTAASSIPISPLQNVNLLEHILEYVGNLQYRFVAGVCHDFKEVYLELYSNCKRTVYNTSTIGHTAICLEEGKLSQDHFDVQCALSTSAARSGNLASLQYLHSMGCSRMLMFVDLCGKR
jgi:hypothetical protein